MSTVNLWNSLRTPVRIKVFSQVVDNLSDSPDVVHQHTRYVPTAPSGGVPNDYTLAPGTSTPVDSNFWATFQSQSASSTLLTSHIIYAVP
jgi:hypothetical protein